MLWEAGQARIGREGRERLAELYIGVRDAYVSANVGLGKATSRGSHIPAYAQPAEDVGRRGLAQLMADFPGQVVKGREFTN